MNLTTLATTKPNRRETRYHRFYQIVDELVAEIQGHSWHETGQLKRRLGGQQLSKLRVSVETLIRDSVAVVYQRKRKAEASIQLNRNWYSSAAAPAGLTHSIHIERSYNAMIELGYLNQTKNGVYDRQRRKDGSSRSSLTRYEATDRLTEKFTSAEQDVFPAIVPPQLIHAPIRVQVKDDDGRKEVFLAAETDETLRMAKNLKRINRVLDRRWYDIEIPDHELAELQAEMAKGHAEAKPIALDRRQLYRVFNDRKLTTGGRFYGGWWQNIPKGYRRHLIVNGKRMVEVDYSNMHPAILYAEVGEVMPNDCYRGIFDSQVESRAGGDLRDMIKSAFNAMLNAQNELQRPPKGIKPGIFGMTWKQVSKAIISSHEPIAHFFYTGDGGRLQRKDSDVAERVLMDFIDLNIPILPIHDSFLVHEGHRGLLDEKMKIALYEICRVEARVKVMEPDLSRVSASLKEHQKDDPEGFGSDVTQNLDELLEGRTGYDKRLDAFWALQNELHHPD
jgi:hypothetical protein